MDEWSRIVGRRPDGMALYHRLQASRAALTLLLCAGRNSLLVRVRRDGDSLLTERRISELAAERDLHGLRVPTLAGFGEIDGWHWTAFTIMATRPHRPVYRLPDGAAAEVGSLVEAIVPRPAGIPGHWAAAHLDMTPWNLRRGSRQTWLIDWEDAGWAPPGADEIYLGAVVAAIRPGRVRPLPRTEQTEESLAYWADIVRARTVEAVESTLNERLLDALTRNADART